MIGLVRWRPDFLRFVPETLFGRLDGSAGDADAWTSTLYPASHAVQAVRARVSQVAMNEPSSGARVVSADLQMTGGQRADQMAGGSGDDHLRGLAGNDLLNGGLGNDSLLGGWGDDQLLGGDGDDFIVGGWGSDTLDGGAGADILKGGHGADTFRFGDGDRISDFTPGEDLIDLAGAGVTATEFGNSAKLMQNGDDAVLWIGAARMTLTGVNADDFAISNFHFAGAVAGLPEPDSLGLPMIHETVVKVEAFATDAQQVQTPDLHGPALAGMIAAGMHGAEQPHDCDYIL